MNPLIRFKTVALSLLVPLVLVCFVFSPRVHALLPPPPPDGGYPIANTAEGEDALFNLTSGTQNTAIGFHALFSNTTGEANTATGAGALSFNISGFGNTATGSQALISNRFGDGNTASGEGALQSNDTGDQNTANGLVALSTNIAGNDNTANGAAVLYSNITGNRNTANGLSALYYNIAGNNNTANGVFALINNTTGSFNVALGLNAGSNLTTGDNNIDIGNEGVAAEANTIRIGTQGTQTAAFIAGISGTPIGGGGSTVRVNANGQLGTAPSSARFKQNIKPMDKASEAIHALKPVTFRYKQELDPEGIPQFGLVAEEVEKISPDLVACDRDGKPYTVRYDAVNAMLLNEFLKEHRTVQEQKATITRLQERIETVIARLEEQESQLQKVSAQLELNRPRPQMVSNNQ